MSAWDRLMHALEQEGLSLDSQAEEIVADDAKVPSTTVQKRSQLLTEMLERIHNTSYQSTRKEMQDIDRVLHLLQQQQADYLRKKQALLTKQADRRRAKAKKNA